MDTGKSIINVIEDQIVQGDIHLPVLEKMANTVHHLFDREDVSNNQIATVIEKEPAIVVKILNLANSAAFSGVSKVHTVERAIARLGLKNVKNFMMTQALKDIFKGKNPLLYQIFQTWWKHSLACAIFCKRLVERVKRPQLADDAYLLGLLHDIGTVFILNTIERVNEEMEGCFENNAELLQEILDSLHARASGEILRKLEFDENFCRIVATHHTPDDYEDPENILFNVLQVVNSILCKIGIAIKSDPSLTIISLPSAKRLDVDPVFIAMTEIDIEDEVAALESNL
jgi:HD-like signal output (HDOD) protein